MEMQLFIYLQIIYKTRKPANKNKDGTLVGVIKIIYQV